MDSRTAAEAPTGYIIWLGTLLSGWQIGMIVSIIPRVQNGILLGLLPVKKVLRGGSWADLPVALRVSARFSAEPEFQDRTVGFRCAMDASKP